MTDNAVYGDYDRSQLDAQYDNRARVPEYLDYHDAWTADGEAVLAEFGHRLDIPFGPSAEETLDIYLPENAAGAPVNVFLHGGYWMSRHKNDFRFIARGMVPAGAMSVIVNYALVPSVDLDELVRQCRAAVAWVHANIAEHGGDPERIFVSGHSAGGHLTAMMMVTDWPAFANGLPADLVKGGLALSGIYDLTPVRLCYLQDTLGFTGDQAARNSPMTMPPPGQPLIVAVGGDESEEFLRQAGELTQAWGPGLPECELMVRPGIDHFTILNEFSDPASDLTRAALTRMGLG